MSMKVKVYGDRLDLADELEDEFHADAKAVIGEAGDLLLVEVQRRLRQRKGTRQTAAPAGEAPESDTGALAGSFSRIPPSVKGRVASSGVQSDHPGANRQEFGMTDRLGIRTFPHPFLAPSLQAVEAPVTDLIQRKLS